MNKDVIKIMKEKVIEIAKHKSIMTRGIGMIKMAMTTIKPNAKAISVRLRIESNEKADFDFMVALSAIFDLYPFRA